jgi:hypothetical protein
MIMRRHANKIAIAMCSLALPVMVGCAEVKSELRKRIPGLAANKDKSDKKVIVIDVDDSYWQIEYEKEKLRMLEEQQRRQSARIREHIRSMLPEE